MKFCNKCGSECADEAKFCPRCGESCAVEAPEPQPAPPAADAITFDSGDAGQAAYVPPVAGEAPKNNATLWLILNIVVTVVCCCNGGLLGIVGIIFSAMAMSKYKKGDFEGAKSNEKVGMIMFFVVLGLSIILGIIALASGILTNLSDLSYYY